MKTDKLSKNYAAKNVHHPDDQSPHRVAPRLEGVVKNVGIKPKKKKKVQTIEKEI